MVEHGEFSLWYLLSGVSLEYKPEKSVNWCTTVKPPPKRHKFIDSVAIAVNTANRLAFPGPKPVTNLMIRLAVRSFRIV